MPKNKFQFLSQATLLFLSVLPAILIGVLIIKYSVNSPFLDQWGIAPYINKTLRGIHISWAEFIAQHNESRLFFPRLIFIGLAYLTKWDVRYEMLLTLFLACIISFNLYLLNRLTVGVGNGKLKELVILLIFNILIFSPIQYENWLWGIQMIVFIPILCITIAIVISYSQLNVKIKFITCIFLATFSTFSYANGMLSWLVIIPVLAFHTWKELQKDKWLFIVWLFAFDLNLSIYFYDYYKPPQHPDLKNVSPLDLARYFFCFLGSPFSFNNLNLALIMGIALLFTFMVLCAYLLYFRKDYTLCYRTIGWLSIAFYTLISALITSFGRAGFGVGQAMAPRYTTFSLYFPIALISLLLISIEYYFQKVYLAKPKYRRLVSVATLGLLTIFLCLHTISANLAIETMSDWRRERLQGKACLMLINVVESKKCIEEKVYPDIKTVKRVGNKINQIGLLNPSLIKSKKIQDIQENIEYSGDNYGYGWFDDVTKINKNLYLANGWGRLPERQEPADAVILTYENTQHEDIIFAISDTRTDRHDIVKITHQDGYLMSGWKKIFSASKLPKGKVKIDAWAFDTNTGKAFQLNGSHIIENQ